VNELTTWQQDACVTVSSPEPEQNHVPRQRLLRALQVLVQPLRKDFFAAVVVPALAVVLKLDEAHQAHLVVYRAQQVDAVHTHTMQALVVVVRRTQPAPGLSTHRLSQRVRRQVTESGGGMNGKPRKWLLLLNLFVHVSNVKLQPG